MSLAEKANAGPLAAMPLHPDRPILISTEAEPVSFAFAALAVALVATAFAYVAVHGG